ncbi:hypothetical protein [Chromobacterium subtsugae]|uniref:hypothetical protein n=1 Tax=Chromobacterium subtsugae TaxID=251747 RepID=UPI0012FF93F9|nr:hypothetical protein [Chromobacterium subtsugae]
MQTKVSQILKPWLTLMETMVYISLTPPARRNDLEQTAVADGTPPTVTTWQQPVAKRADSAGT